MSYEEYYANMNSFDSRDDVCGFDANTYLLRSCFQRFVAAFQTPGVHPHTAGTTNSAKNASRLNDRTADFTQAQGPLM